MMNLKGKESKEHVHLGYPPVTSVLNTLLFNHPGKLSCFFCKGQSTGGIADSKTNSIYSCPELFVIKSVHTLEKS